jgi:hypothetical protein
MFKLLYNLTTLAFISAFAYSVYYGVFDWIVVAILSAFTFVTTAPRLLATRAPEVETVSSILFGAAGSSVMIIAMLHGLGYAGRLLFRWL